MKLPTGTVHTDFDSPIGRLLLAAHRGKLIGCWFEDQSNAPDLSALPRQPDEPVLVQAASQLQDYLVGRRRNFDLPLDISSGTAFQQSVWQALTSLVYGGHCTYGDLARHIGRPAAVRAVGGAVGRNPLGIILPCHRVLGANGKLTGYTGGLGRKIALLQLEGVL